MPASAPDLPRALSEVIANGELVVPPYPVVAMRLRRIVERENFGLSEVAEAAAADPALAAALLRVANSPLYGALSAPITTLGRAVHRLGARSVAAIATAVGVSGNVTTAGPLIDVRYRVWRRSITCALACQRFASSRGVDAEEAFLAGLLHGFGRCVAVACLERLLPRLPQQSMSLVEWMDAVEPYRARLARAVADQWQLPEALREALGAREQSPPPGPTAKLVDFAERIASAIEQGGPTDQVARTAGIAPGERQAVDAFLTDLPAAIEALVQPPEVIQRSSSATSAVRKPETMLRGELRKASLPVQDLRVRRDPVALKVLAMTADGLLLEAERPMQESCVARLAVGPQPNPLEGWFSVLLCASEGARFRVEVQAFAPSRELKKFLFESWAAASPASTL